MKEGFVLYPLHVKRSSVEGQELLQAIAAYQLGFVEEVVTSDKYQAYVRTYMGKCQVEMESLSEIERIIWYAYIPQCATANGYIRSALAGSGNPKVVPEKVLQHYRQALEQVVFEYFRVLWSTKVPDVMMIGIESGSHMQYTIAQWTTNNTPPATLATAKDWLRRAYEAQGVPKFLGYSISHAVMDACDQHDRLST